MKTKILILSAFFSIMALSCSKDNNNVDTTNITAEEAGINSKVDAATDDVTGISENQINNVDSNTPPTKFSIDQNPFAASCATVTRVPAFGITPQPGELVTKTIDFGSGCTLQNGNTLKGKIIISFNYNLPVNNWTVTFENFYHNNIKVNGTKTYTRTMVGSPAHPKITVDINVTITLSDGRVLTRTGQRIWEFIVGYDTPASITDNQHQVTGSWTTTYPNTSTQTATITTPLLIKMECTTQQKPLIVKGVISYVRGRHNATLDFGDGTCDNIAIFTKDGISVQINIGR